MQSNKAATPRRDQVNKLHYKQKTKELYERIETLGTEIKVKAEPIADEEEEDDDEYEENEEEDNESNEEEEKVP